MTDLKDIELSNGLLLSQKLSLDIGEDRGLTNWLLDGRNQAVGSGAFENVWNVSTAYTWTAPGSEETVSIVSDNAADDKDAGAGAQKIFIQGLDANFNEITETVELEGLTPVITVNEYLRINRATITQVGTYGAGATGNVTGTGSSSAKTWFNILPTEAKTELGWYTVPARKRAILTWSMLSSGSNQEIDLIYQVRGNADVTTSPFIQVAHFWLNNQLIAFPTPAASSITGPADIQVLAQAATGNGNISVQTNFILIDV
jgi:hypothetical protein